MTLDRDSKMATFHRVRHGLTLMNRINVHASQNCHEFAADKLEGKPAVLNTIQKRCFHQKKNIIKSTVGMSSTQNYQGGLLPTWSVYSAQMQRNKSTETAQLANASDPLITPAAVAGVGQQAPGSVPESPVLPDAADLAQILPAIGEPSLSNLGIGGYFPSGIYQHVLELLHVYGHLPWWASIIAATMMLRALTLKLTVKSQKDIVTVHNVYPKYIKLKTNYDDAMLSRDKFAKNYHKQLYEELLKEIGISTDIRKASIAPIGLGVAMVPMFMGLKKLADCPVDSMKEGGLLWFTDLTACDPYFILPVLAATTFALTLEVGADGVSVNHMGQNMRYFVRSLPVISFVFMMNLPAALSYYWFLSNLVSLGLTELLQKEEARKYFNIPKKIVHSEKSEKENNWKAEWTQYYKKLQREKADKDLLREEKFKLMNSPSTIFSQKTFADDPLAGKRKKQTPPKDMKKLF